MPSRETILGKADTMRNKLTKVEKLARDDHFIRGVEEHFAHRTLDLRRQRIPAAKLVALVKAHIKRIRTIDAIHASWLREIAAEAADDANLVAIMAAVRHYVAAISASTARSSPTSDSSRGRNARRRPSRRYARPSACARRGSRAARSARSSVSRSRGVSARRRALGLRSYGLDDGNRTLGSRVRTRRSLARHRTGSDRRTSARSASRARR